MDWASSMHGKIHAYEVLVGKPEGRYVHRWNVIFKTLSKEIGYK
jgi:hypothetical protein